MRFLKFLVKRSMKNHLCVRGRLGRKRCARESAEKIREGRKWGGFDDFGQ